MSEGGYSGSAARGVRQNFEIDRTSRPVGRRLTLARNPLLMASPLSPAAFFGLCAFSGFALLLFFDSRLAPLPLIAFVVACTIAPSLPRVGFFLPVISRGKPGERGVALTFDDGPDPELTPQLLDLLERHDVSATFFVTGEKATRHPEIIREIISRGHSIGNHSFSHMPHLMLKGMRTLRREVKAAQSVLGLFNIVPLAFRPPVGITNPHLWPVLIEQKMFCVTFSCRGMDMGNRWISRLSSRVLRKVAPGDIVALHDVAPPRASAERVLGEFESLISGLKEKGLEIVPLARLIGTEVMQRLEDKSPGGYNDKSLGRGRSRSMTVKEQLKKIIIEGINLEEVRPEDIVDSAPLFGEGLGLDSLDAVELVVLIQKHFGIEIKDMEEGREAFRSIDSLAAFVEERRRG